MVNVRVFRCSEDECDDIVSRNVGVVFIHNQENSPSEPAYFDDTSDIQILAKKVLEQLPEPEDLSIDDFWVMGLQFCSKIPQRLVATSFIIIFL